MLTEDDKQWINQQLHQQLHQQLETLEGRFTQQLETLETKLLTAFHDWASPTEQRLRSHSAVMRALDLELETLQERVTKLEQQQPPKQ